jgi:energy-coupling factor transporter ATP-binding protein EcfA2
MKISSVRAKNFLTFDGKGIALDDLAEEVYLVGPNGSGKSSTLRAIEFLSEAFSDRLPYPGTYVHRQDTALGIEIDVGVRFNEDEARLASVAALVTAGREVRNVQTSTIDTQEANRVVRLALGECKGLFEPLFREEVHYCLRTTPGYAQTAERYVRVSSPGGDLCFDSSGRLSRAPYQSNSWSIVSLPDELYTRIKASAPDAFQLGKPKTRFAREALIAVARSFESSWLYDSLAEKDGQPTSLNLETFRMDTILSTPPVLAREQTLELEAFLQEPGRQPPSVSVFGVLGSLLVASIEGLSDYRTKIGSLGGGHPWAPWDPGSGPLSFDLPQTLFDLKNSPDLAARRRFERLLEVFEDLSGVSVDVAWERRTVASAEDGTPSRVVGLPVLSFSEGTLAYPGSLAAAGHCELLSVLSAVSGPSGSAILLDEPALNLHPVKQRELLARIRALSTDAGNQLVVVTHSQEFVQASTLAHTYRFALRDRATSVNSLGIEDRKLAGKIGKLVELDPAVSGALFARRVVLVEGHDELAALPIWLSKCGPDLDLRTAGVLFLNVEGQLSFPWYVEAMDAWGVPCRMIGDSGAAKILDNFRPRGFAYQAPDLTDVFTSYCKPRFDAAKAAWGGGDKNPLVARTVAIESPPPVPIKEVWEFLRPFLEGTTD